MDTKQKILYAAAEKFAKDGYHKTTIRDICNHADVNIAAVNYHFKGKAELYLKVYEYLFIETDDEWDREELSFKSFSEWKSYIYSWVFGLLRNISSSREIYQWKSILYAREMVEPTEHFLVLYHSFFEPRLLKLEKNIEYGFSDRKAEKNFIKIQVFSIMSQILFYAQNKKLVSLVYGPDFYSKENIETIARDITNGVILKSKNN